MPKSMNRVTRRNFLTGATTAGLVGGAKPVFAADEATLLAAAKKEGKAMFYTAVDPILATNLVNGFKKKYQLDFDMVRTTSTPLAQRFSSEMQTGNRVADIISVTDTAIIREGVKAGWFADPSDVPAFASWPKDAHYESAVICGYIPHGICWNTNQLPKGIARNEDLLDPALKGRVLLADPRVLPNLVQWYVMLMDLYGEDFVRKLGEQSSFSPSSVPAMQQVAAGANAVFAPAAHNVVGSIKGKGAPITHAFVDPILRASYMAGLVKGSAHPNAARLFLNYWMSPEGQSIANHGGFAALPNVPETEQAVLKVTPEIEPERLARETPKIIGLFGLG